MNLADDEEMLQQMRDVEFRYLFMGIETPDPDLLAATQKRVNAMAPITERIARIYENGIAVSAGFIVGFDGEKGGNDQVLITCIESTGIVVAMIGLLVALPNTQLARRLQKEKRLLSASMELLDGEDEKYQLVTAGSHAEGADQAAGLNYVTTRDRVEIYREYQNVLARVYDPKHFMDRVLATTRRIQLQRLHRPGWKETWRDLGALVRVAWWMTQHKHVRRYYWRKHPTHRDDGCQKIRLRPVHDAHVHPPRPPVGPCPQRARHQHRLRHPPSHLPPAKPSHASPSSPSTNKSVSAVGHDERPSQATKNTE